MKSLLTGNGERMCNVKHRKTFHLNDLCESSFKRWKLFFWLFLFTFAALANGEGLPEATEEKAVLETKTQVTVKLKDAERFTNLGELRKELHQLNEAVQRSESDNAELRETNEKLHRELQQALQTINAQKQTMEQWQIGVAGVLETGKIPVPGDREAELSKTLALLTERGMNLAVKAAEFVKEIEALPEEEPLTKVRTTQLRLKGDALASQARQFSAMTNWQPPQAAPERCRILAVDRELGVVVLPVGSAQGATNGLTYYVPGKEEEIAMTIVYIRPLLALATMVRGNIDSLSPGLEVAANRKQQEE